MDIQIDPESLHDMTLLIYKPYQAVGTSASIKG
jgi:hypothetical protein